MVTLATEIGVGLLLITLVLYRLELRLREIQDSLNKLDRRILTEQGNNVSSETASPTGDQAPKSMDRTRTKNMHYVPESSSDEKCSCGEQASHKVEEVIGYESAISIDEIISLPMRHPLTTYLCCACFSKLMGLAASEWCREAKFQVV